MPRARCRYVGTSSRGAARRGRRRPTSPTARRTLGSPCASPAPWRCGRACRLGRMRPRRALPHPGMAPGGAGARARAVWPAPDRAPCLQGGHGAHRGARWPPRSCQPVGTRATLWRRKEPSMHEDARQLTTASGRGSVANHRKQESLDSQVIDFLRENFCIWLPKANFATEPPTLTNRVPQIFPLSNP